MKVASIYDSFDELSTVGVATDSRRSSEELQMDGSTGSLHLFLMVQICLEFRRNWKQLGTLSL